GHASGAVVDFSASADLDSFRPDDRGGAYSLAENDRPRVANSRGDVSCAVSAELDLDAIHAARRRPDLVGSQAVEDGLCRERYRHSGITDRNRRERFLTAPARLSDIDVSGCGAGRLVVDRIPFRLSDVDRRGGV